MSVETILIADIDDTKRLRPLDMARVEAYAASIEDSRLIQPIVVRRNVGEYLGEKTYVLTAGGHRLAALKLLGWTELTIGDHVVIRDETAADAEYSEVIENIFQPELNAVDRIIFLGRAKELHDAKRIETRGRKRKDTDFKDKKIMADSAIISSPRFTKEIAAKIGLAETVIKEACRIAKALDPEAISAIRGTMLEDNQVELRALAALEPEHQREIAGYIKAGTVRNVLQGKWIAGLEKEPLNDPQARILTTLLDQFEKATKQTRAQFMKAAGLAYRKDEDAK